MRVPSSTSPGVTYEVNLVASTCTCPSYTLGRQRPCKHLRQATAAAQEFAAQAASKAQRLIASGYSPDDLNVQDLIADSLVANPASQPPLIGEPAAASPLKAARRAALAAWARRYLAVKPSKPRRSPRSKPLPSASASPSSPTPSN